MRAEVDCGAGHMLACSAAVSYKQFSSVQFSAVQCSRQRLGPICRPTLAMLQLVKI